MPCKLAPSLLWTPGSGYWGNAPDADTEALIVVICQNGHANNGGGTNSADCSKDRIDNCAACAQPSTEDATSCCPVMCFRAVEAYRKPTKDRVHGWIRNDRKGFFSRQKDLLYEDFVLYGVLGTNGASIGIPGSGGIKFADRRAALFG